MSDTEVEDHFNPTVRLINIERNGSNCGFQLTRSKWDPYPWVNSVITGTAADLAGVKSGDCLLEVNGEDVLGRRISEIAEIVKSKSNQVSLLLWNAGVDSQCTPEAICCGPMPTNLQRLSACMSSIIAFLECPVCLDTIPPPTYQCENGHLICIRCRTKSERCPICRLRYTRGRSLLGDQIYNALIDAFNLREESTETRTFKMQQIFKIKNKNKNVPEIKVTPSHANKFLARLVGKANSVDNLADSKLENTNNEGMQLRAKSLSTQEIFAIESPIISRTNSVRKFKTNFLNPEYRSSSCHGSFEILHRNIDEEDLVFYCPFALKCNYLIRGKNITEHFQISHDGPLIQFFKPHLKINSKKIMKHRNLCYLIQFEKNTFFLKIEAGDETNGNVLLWIWLMDSKKAAKDFYMQVRVVTIEENIIMSVQNNVFSLNSTSYQDIKDNKKGALFNIKSLLLVNTSSNEIIFEIDILKSDYM